MDNLIQAAAVTLFAASAAQAQQAVQWKVSDGGNGHWYRMVVTPAPTLWVNAKSLAESLGGHLASIRSDGENGHCLGVCDGGPVVPGGSAWLGAVQPNGEASPFAWVTGEPFDWTPGCGFSNTDAGCGFEDRLTLTSPWTGCPWNDVAACWHIPALLVEWDADCNADGIVDYGQCRDGSLPDYNGNNVPDCCEQGTPCLVGSYPVQWRVNDGGNGHWYQIQELTNRPTCIEAAVLANAVGARLIALQTESEADYFRILRCARGQTLLSAWQDLRLVNGAWTWGSGEPFVYQAWSPGMPDFGDAATIDQSGGSCETLTWGDEICGIGNLPSSLFLEWSADCNADGIVDYGQILQGQLPDTNSNGIPDSCEGPPPDCNGDGIADGIQCRDGSLQDYNGNNVPDCCEQGQPCAAGRYPVQWREDAGGNGHWYLAQRWDGTRSWPQARALAEFVGGYLACVTSASERAWLHDHATWDQPGCGPGREGWHIGGFQDTSAPDYAEPSGGWRWVTGEPWVYTAWLTNVPGGDRPNNVGGNEHFLKISELPFAPRWDDVGPGGGQGELCGAVIEWSADCNYDGIVDKGQILLGQLADVNADGVPDACQQSSCERADLYPDASINGADLGIMLSQWGAVTPSTRADLNLDGAVDGVDLGILLSFWGPCP